MVQICKNIVYDRQKRKKKWDIKCNQIQYNQLPQDPDFIVDEYCAKKILGKFYRREYTVLKLLINGYSFQDIAKQLGISLQQTHLIARSVKTKSYS